jgi:hypothetical protein
MPFYSITTSARADIAETWLIEADDEEAAREAFDDFDGALATFIGDSVTGEEEGREIVAIHADNGALANAERPLVRLADHGPEIMEILRELGFGTTTSSRMNEIMQQSRDILASIGEA